MARTRVRKAFMPHRGGSAHDMKVSLDQPAHINPKPGAPGEGASSLPPSLSPMSLARDRFAPAGWQDRFPNTGHPVETGVPSQIRRYLQSTQPSGYLSTNAG